jgi:hypothetical protein
MVGRGFVRLAAECVQNLLIWQPRSADSPGRRFKVVSCGPFAALIWAPHLVQGELLALVAVCLTAALSTRL